MRRRSLASRLLSVAVVLAVAGGGVIVWRQMQSRGNTPPYRVARVQRGPLTAAVSATGTLNAVVTVLVGSQVSGQIIQLQADYNSPVRRGQVIARIDPATFEAKTAQARAEVDVAEAAVLTQGAQVERARADLENARGTRAEAAAQTARARIVAADARRDAERKAELHRKDLVARGERDSAEAAHGAAEAQLDAARAREAASAAAIGASEAQLKVARASLESARAQVERARAALRQALVDLDHTTIRAPVDGVVVSRSVDVGQTVAASLQAPTLFTIAQDLTRMQVDTSVDEADIGRVQLDAAVTFTVDAFPTRTFSGRVTQVRKAAAIVQNVVTYTVVVAVDNPGGQLMPGMTAHVRIVVAERPDALKVPNAALRFRPVGVEPDQPTARGASPTAPAGRTPGRETAEQLRERLVAALKLAPEQQARLDPILAETRAQLATLSRQELPADRRQAETQRIRDAARTRIRDILMPEQRARYDTLGSQDAGRQGRVWVLGPDGRPRAIPLALGITDGAMTEVLSGAVEAGQEVLTGSSTQPPAKAPASGQSTPRIRL